MASRFHKTFLLKFDHHITSKKWSNLVRSGGLGLQWICLSSALSVGEPSSKSSFYPRVGWRTIIQDLFLSMNHHPSPLFVQEPVGEPTSMSSLIGSVRGTYISEDLLGIIASHASWIKLICNHSKFRHYTHTSVKGELNSHWTTESCLHFIFGCVR